MPAGWLGHVRVKDWMNGWNRAADVGRFYTLVDQLEAAIGGKHAFNNQGSRRNLPVGGVYFFFEPDELRTDSGSSSDPASKPHPAGFVVVWWQAAPRLYNREPRGRPSGARNFV